ncbi:hypothetical protein CYMTET_23921 [Cymbomonas tetramitiformis]|uniref:Uncharacterized protein n=1 Tax=Cymbomonas tetramitiformis TaxID=36881 RepID=A0AAE0L0G2_9CHLO|nr:hypothetical protein CYMTET_23921 [Cymbomonas tetramitiformis]
MAEKTTVTIVAIFCAYVAYTTYNMYGFFVPPAAKAGESCISNLFSESSQPLDLRLYVSTEPKMRYSRALNKAAEWEELNFIYNSTYMTQATKNLTVSIPAPVQRGKRPLYAHIFVSSAGADSKSGRFDWHLLTRTTLVRSLPIPPPSTKRRLLGEPASSIESDASPATESSGGERFHWIPHIRLHMVWDFTCFGYRTIPSDVHRAYQFVERDSRYIPPLAVDEFHVRNDVIAPLIVNDTTVELPLEISFGPLSIGWWRLYSNLQNSLDMMQQSMGAEEKDTDDIRRM